MTDEELLARADAVVLPASAEEVSRVVGWCYERDVPIVPRGGGTGYAGGAVPLDGGVVLSLERLTKLRSFETLHWRMPQLLGRQRELAEIATFATGQESYRWLVGGAYAGKSALLYEAVTVGLPDEVDVVCYFLSRRASAASSDTL